MSTSTLTNLTIIECPHCQQSIEILELNCRIFRCGIYKRNFCQIDPHMPKIFCEELVANNAIYGCGKPFKIEIINQLQNEKNAENKNDENKNNENNKIALADLSFNVIICDYI